MSDRPTVPYIVQFTLAVLAQNKEVSNKILSSGLDSTTSDCTALVGSYDRKDLPIVLASMRLVHQALLPVLSPSEKQLMEQLVSHTTCITINPDGFKNGDKS